MKNHSRCCKCGCTQIIGPRHVNEYGWERLVYRCWQCGYSWTTATLDRQLTALPKLLAKIEPGERFP